jgi:DnaJ-class molecular chaperone
MSDTAAKADDRCQACNGTGSVAGAQPVRTGPFLLNPPVCRVCGGSGRKPEPGHGT